MRFTIARRALVAAAAITLLTVPSVAAESVGADGDAVTAGFQDTIDLGTVAPGQDVGYYVYFAVTCSGTSHVDASQTIRLSPGTRAVPSGGGVSVSTLNFGLPSGWPVDGADCPTDLTPYLAGPLHIILTAPMTAGTDYRYRLSWNRTVLPASATDAGLWSGTNPTINFVLDVGTPPTLELPADSTVEGNTTDGATAAYTVTATDAEDAVAPTPTCNPAVGDVLPLGPTTVNCTATDSDDLSTIGSFTITVVDTTAPALAGMPADVSLTTSGSSATLTYASPTASDIVDASPTVGCLPVSGSDVPVGDTAVTCTARDASGNTASASFVTHVAFVAPPPPPVIDPPADPPAPSNPPADPPAPPSNPPADPPAPPSNPPADPPAPPSNPPADPPIPPSNPPADPPIPPSNPPADPPIPPSNPPADPPIPPSNPPADPPIPPSNPPADPPIPPSNPPANPPATGHAYWESPVHGSGKVVVNRARTLPIKVRLVIGGKKVTSGQVVLSVARCGETAVVRTLALHRQHNGRWMGHLSTGGLGAGCYQAVVAVNGQALGSFTIEIRGRHGAHKPGKDSAGR